MTSVSIKDPTVGSCISLKMPLGCQHLRRHLDVLFSYLDSLNQAVLKKCKHLSVLREWIMNMDRLLQFLLSGQLFS